MYRQVEAHLRGLIDSDRFRTGDRLPSELELARELGVNRLTVRQAIAELRRAGVLTVRQGAGTFVAEPPLDMEVSVSPPSSAEAVSAKVADTFSGLARTVVEQRIGWTVVEGTSPDAELPCRHLSADRRARLLRIDAVMHVDDEPWITSSYWVRRARFGSLPNLWGEGADLNQAIAEHYAIHLKYGWRSFGAVAATERDRDLLDVPAGSPLLVREGVNVDPSGTPVFYVHRRCRSDKVRFLYRYT